MNNERLNIDEIKQYLKTERKIVIFNETDSTNLRAKELLKLNSGEVLVLAEKQTSGRGRLGRSFFSPESSGLYMTLGIKPKLNADKLVMLTALTAVAVSRAIDSLFNIDTKIKWVNDIYYNEKKICGILAETVFSEKGEILYTVVGIGVNVCVPAGGFPEDIKDKAGAINSKKTISRNRLAAEMINQFDMLYKKIDTLDFLEEYRNKSCLIGEMVTVMPINGEAYKAEILEIDDCAHLLVKTDNGKILTLSGGEVSIVPKM